MFKEGVRVLVTGSVPGDNHRVNAKGMYGTIYKYNYGTSWYVKMDNHPGFLSQYGCWKIREGEMKVVAPPTNMEALSLLKKEVLYE